MWSTTNLDQFPVYIVIVKKKILSMDILPRQDSTLEYDAENWLIWYHPSIWITKTNVSLRFRFLFTLQIPIVSAYPIHHHGFFAVLMF